MKTLDKINLHVSNHSGLYLLGIVLMLFFNTCGSFFEKSNTTYSQEQIDKIEQAVGELKERSCQMASKDDLIRTAKSIILIEKSLDKNSITDKNISDFFILPSNCE